MDVIGAMVAVAVVAASSKFGIHCIVVTGSFGSYELYTITARIGRLIILTSIIVTNVGMSETIAWCFR